MNLEHGWRSILQFERLVGALTMPYSAGWGGVRMPLWAVVMPGTFDGFDGQLKDGGNFQEVGIIWEDCFGKPRHSGDVAYPVGKDCPALPFSIKPRCVSDAGKEWSSTRILVFIDISSDSLCELPGRSHDQTLVDIFDTRAGRPGFERRSKLL
ncbi:MAG: hypothetical protein M9947_07820 [Thermomicrobiales bacterium]|nr:hypothetical protein [Thermomicrobiales bacterium]